MITCNAYNFFYIIYKFIIKFFCNYCRQFHQISLQQLCNQHYYYLSVSLIFSTCVLCYIYFHIFSSHNILFYFYQLYGSISHFSIHFQIILWMSYSTAFMRFISTLYSIIKLLPIILNHYGPFWHNHISRFLNLCCYIVKCLIHIFYTIIPLHTL